MVPKEHQQHRFILRRIVVGELPQHGVRIAYALGVHVNRRLYLVGQRRCRLHLGADVVAVLVLGIGHVVLYSNGVGKIRHAALDRGLETLFYEPCKATVRNPAALVFKALHVVCKVYLLRAEQLVDLVAPIEPAVARVHEAGRVALGGEDTVQAVKRPLHAAEGRQRGRIRVEQVRLHTRCDVELSVRRAASEVGNDDVSGIGVLAGSKLVVGLHRVLALGKDEDVLVQDVRKRLVHYENDVQLRRIRGAFIVPIPALGLVPVEARGLCDAHGREVVAEIVREAQLACHGTAVVGFLGLEGLIKCVRAVGEGDQTHQQQKAEQASRGPDEAAPLFFRTPHRQQDARRDEQGRQQHEDARLEPGQAQVVVPHGVRRLFDQHYVPGHEGFAAHRYLHSVYERHHACHEPGGCRAVHGACEGEAQGRAEQGDGQPVQEKQQRALQHARQGPTQRRGLGPEHKQQYQHRGRKPQQGRGHGADVDGMLFQFRVSPLE